MVACLVISNMLSTIIRQAARSIQDQWRLRSTNYKSRAASTSREVASVGAIGDAKTRDRAAVRGNRFHLVGSAELVIGLATKGCSAEPDVGRALCRARNRRRVSCRRDAYGDISIGPDAATSSLVFS